MSSSRHNSPLLLLILLTASLLAMNSFSQVADGNLIGTVYDASGKVIPNAIVGAQNIATGVSVTNLKGQEGAVLARTFIHSIILTLVLVVIVIVQQYLVPEIIPHFVAK